MNKQEALIVSQEEAEQKLLAFLVRRTQAPKSALHKWIRTGQVRLNGKRTNPFERLAFGDNVRIPPFAYEYLEKDNNPDDFSEHLTLKNAKTTTQSQADLPSKNRAFSSIYEDENLLIIDKDAGLPVQGGTGHTDSLALRLKAHYAGKAFIPSPAHRLDKDCSGLLAIGKSYTTLRLLQDLFARRPLFTPHEKEQTEKSNDFHQGKQQKEAIVFEKNYLAWLCGKATWHEATELCHLLFREQKQGFERMKAYRLAGEMKQNEPRLGASKAKAEKGQEARCEVLCLRHIEWKGFVYSLVRVNLLTGRRHQIRAQMAAEGLPILGDRVYGGRDFPLMLLHAHQLTLPKALFSDMPQHRFEALPKWPQPFDILE